MASFPRKTRDDPWLVLSHSHSLTSLIKISCCVLRICIFANKICTLCYTSSSQPTASVYFPRLVLASLFPLADRTESCHSRLLLLQGKLHWKHRQQLSLVLTVVATTHFFYRVSWSDSRQNSLNSVCAAYPRPDRAQSVMLQLLHAFFTSQHCRLVAGHTPMISLTTLCPLLHDTGEQLRMRRDWPQ